jgi:hypothetical protein
MIQWIISSDERRELERAAAEPVKPERKRRAGRPQAPAQLTAAMPTPHVLYNLHHRILAGAAMKRTILTISALLTVPAMAAEPVYHDCRYSEDIVNGRPVHRTVCQNEAGDWVVVPPAKKKPSPPLAPAALRPIKKPVYHDCRYSEDIVNGRTVHKAVCQNEKGDWVERP